MYSYKIRYDLLSQTTTAFCDRELSFFDLSVALEMSARVNEVTMPFVPTCRLRFIVDNIWMK